MLVFLADGQQHEMVDAVPVATYDGARACPTAQLTALVRRSATEEMLTRFDLGPPR
jgi:hypothetical protein